MNKAEVISLRATTELNFGYGKLAQIYKVSAQELMRVALGKYLADNMLLIKEYDEKVTQLFIPTKLEEDEWVDMRSCCLKYIKWNKTKYGNIKFRLAETFTDGGLLVTEVTCVNTFEELIDIIEDVKIENGKFIYDGLEISDREEIEMILMELICLKDGKKIVSKQYPSEDKAKQVLKYLLELHEI